MASSHVRKSWTMNSPPEPTDWKPPAGQLHHYLLRPAWSQQRDQPVRGLISRVPPCNPPQAPCSSQAATQPAASEPGPSTPPPAKRSERTKAEPPAAPTQPTKGKGKAQGKAAKAKPAPQRSTCSALGRVEQGKLPAKGKEYPQLGYKRLRDKPLKAQQQQQQPAEAQ
ncbi:hypothetical protein QJQ45_008907 [Haematococcus lacustris]|nr:hypothetical protein QJQ45_008907 [Haematococcus lacustris]